MVFLDRLFLVIFALLLVVLALFVLGITAGWTVPLAYLDTWFSFYPEATGGVGMALLLLGLWLFFRNFQKRAPTRFLVKSAALGEVWLTLPALESMVVRIARQVRGVKSVRPRIRYREGVFLSLLVGVNPETKIPEISAELQEKLKEGLRGLTGMEVSEIQIVVESLSRETQSRVE